MSATAALLLGAVGGFVVGLSVTMLIVIWTTPGGHR